LHCYKNLANSQPNGTLAMIKHKTAPLRWSDATYNHYMIMGEYYYLRIFVMTWEEIKDYFIYNVM